MRRSNSIGGIYLSVCLCVYVIQYGALISGIVCLVTLLIFFTTAFKHTIKCVDFSDFLNFT